MGQIFFVVPFLKVCKKKISLLKIENKTKILNCKIYSIVNFYGIFFKVIECMLLFHFLFVCYGSLFSIVFKNWFKFLSSLTMAVLVKCLRIFNHVTWEIYLAKYTWMNGVKILRKIKYEETNCIRLNKKEMKNRFLSQHTRMAIIFCFMSLTSKETLFRWSTATTNIYSWS